MDRSILVETNDSVKTMRKKKSFAGKILMYFLMPFRRKRLIVFESHPDLADNTWPVYLYFRDHEPKYKLLWMTSEKTVTDLPHITYKSSNFLKKLHFEFTIRTCGAIVSSNQFFKSFYEGQVSLYLAHGSKTKNTRGVYEPGKEVDYIDVQSHFFDDVVKYGYDATQEQLVYLGYPRCDWFYNTFDITSGLDELGVSGKYIIWLPTFRKNRSQSRNVQSALYESMGMPLIYNEDMLESLNEVLKKSNYQIVFKPHPSQDIKNLTKSKLSNICIINDKQLKDAGIQLYQLIAHSSAMITDYSSVYFDYLLLDRPMATTLDDVDSWKAGRGFAFDLEHMYARTNDSLYKLEDLFSFIEDVLVDGNDSHKEARKEVRDLTNMYNDGGSAKRVAVFVLSKIEGK